uniref:U3 small nucleolar RNA-associated protein 11 n=1 Tax=Chromera velia CCMP2878 TaxID=1169474 RepID=A0A0G4FCE2_9ALVE|mmetsp:Transcript_52783/g.103213  ORF Transcript_52783/g.103213 Transcript_52783/m.103213 type:complete len:300 (-) Transcript_52783:297-1196(-)|eukprot:Cvel_16329.t1-p1 / transcript=Cvel_16329.t1 / gene=Cvel_16329 / organism=Chromera_velia_CCMP2878 / gene_product=Probable U3 small nucleolar RNA-associated protein, putative / transcript_product=Probable U3 small nucleolar RNA-associated protein, putative / location=Cvel_scaffold1253:20446-21342(+) / protein_length=299 / sequence_SO=supercontig / SO=protein_coding / is_pseudo=false
MSSYKHLVHRRVHLERHQPERRQRLGLLEKKKDYKLRAEDFHKKQDKVKELAEIARLRNPEEYSRKMAKKAKLVNGKKVILDRDQEGDRAFDSKAAKALNALDRSLISVKSQKQKRKLEGLQGELHMLEAKKPNAHTLFMDSDEEADLLSAAAASAPQARGKREKGKRKREDEEAERLAEERVAAAFDTLPEFLDNRSNLPRKASLKKQRLQQQKSRSGEMGEEDEDEGGDEGGARRERQLLRSYKEMEKRQEKQRQLNRVLQRLEMRRDVSAKGRKKKVGGGEDGAVPVFKWEFQRKK